MIPEIEFRYSGVYDSVWLRPEKKFSKKEIHERIRTIEKKWDKVSKDILKEISKLSGLKWKEKKIKCYVISGGKCISDPLTVKCFKDKDQFIDILTHELIHQIQIQNSNITGSWFKYTTKNYPEESKLTRSHILLHAIHYKLLLNIFGKKRLKKNIENHQKAEDYKRAWEIVEEETPEKIIKKFKEFTR